MRFRFLYLDKNGEETKVESVDELRRCVDEGLIGEDTLLYDARSREWGPARVHTAYRSVLGEEDAVAALDEENVDEGLESGELALADTVPDTVARFLEKRARERREENERRPTARDELDLVDEAATWQRGDGREEAGGAIESADRAAEPSDAPDRAEDEPLGAAAPSPPDHAEPEEPAEPAAARPEARPVTVRVNASGGRGRRSRRWIGVLGAAAVVTGLLAVRGALDEADAAGSGAEVRLETPPPPAANPELEARIREAEGSAFQDMVLAMDSLRNEHGVSGGPREWLSGRYLAGASDFDDVAAYWERYRDYVDELRTRDEEFFRRGFVERLESTGIDGAVLSMRLARATEEFRASEPARESVYAAMEGVATVALELHALLVEREADIVYTPVRPGVVTQDPVLEAVPTDAELRGRIWDTLDRLFVHVDVVRGGVPGSGEQLGDAALEGIRATAHRREP